MKRTRRVWNWRFRVWIMAMVAGSVGVVQGAGRPVRLSLGTLAPRGSVYHQALMAMAQEWRKAPEGGVQLRIFPDGTTGGEADMVRLMRVGTLQAGLLSAVGLSEIERDIAGLQSLPMAFRDYEEFDYVNEKLRPQLEGRLSDKGFKLLFWADTGWVRYFFKEPALTPEQLKQRKVFVWAGSSEQVDIIKRWGGNPVPLETADILTSLQTGLINAVSVPPIFAARSQFHSYAPHMIDLKWGILVGALVIKKEAWDRIPEGTQAFLLASAAKTGKEMIQAGRAEGDEAVEAMVKRGLTVHRLTPELEDRWRAAANEVYPLIRDTLIPGDVFDELQRLLAEYRSKPAGP